MTTKPKRLLFTLTRKDFEVETFCTGGPGGQHKNAKENGVRIKHPASGAVAQETTHREQHRNKAIAFRKLTETPVFKKWHKAEVARVLGTVSDTQASLSVQKRVEAMMDPKQLLIEELQLPLSSNLSRAYKPEKNSIERS